VRKSLDGAAKPISKGFGRTETGATAIEYALIAALISVFIFTGISLTANGINLHYNIITNAMVVVFGN